MEKNLIKLEEQADVVNSVNYRVYFTAKEDSLPNQLKVTDFIRVMIEALLSSVQPVDPPRYIVEVIVICA
uniref:Uncharacterized protein n=1 Tax=Panagrolaimus sp. JU765 TaxID=591449 RepID=A0AC34QNS2_9BILA